MKRLIATTVLVGALTIGATGVASADPKTNILPFDCGSAGILAVAVSPANKFSPLFLADGTGILLVRTVTANGQVVFTNPSFDKSPRPLLTCTFTNSDRTTFVVTGLLTPAKP